MDTNTLMKINSLTKSEFQILRLIVSGYTSLEICEHLHIAKNTLNTLLTHIYNKIHLRVNTRVNLTLWYLKYVLSFKEITFKED